MWVLDVFLLLHLRELTYASEVNGYDMDIII